jgi:hypothetical protein
VVACGSLWAILGRFWTRQVARVRMLKPPCALMPPVKVVAFISGPPVLHCPPSPFLFHSIPRETGTRSEVWCLWRRHPSPPLPRHNFFFVLSTYSIFFEKIINLVRMEKLLFPKIIKITNNGPLSYNPQVTHLRSPNPYPNPNPNPNLDQSTLHPNHVGCVSVWGVCVSESVCVCGCV